MFDAILALIRSPRAAFQRPTETLGPTPRIKSRDDAELALNEIAWCNALEAGVRAKADELLATINRMVAEATAVEEGGLSVCDRRAKLEEAALKWADANRGDLCPGARKSVDLQRGRFSWRSGKAKVDFAEGYTEADVVEAVCHESGLTATLEKLVANLGWFGVFTVKLAVNKTNARDARIKKQISDEELAEVGLEFFPSDETVSLAVHEFVRE